VKLNCHWLGGGDAGSCGCDPSSALKPGPTIANRPQNAVAATTHLRSKKIIAALIPLADQRRFAEAETQHFGRFGRS